MKSFARILWASGAILMGSSASAGAVEPATRLTILELQSAERLVAIAFRVGDIGELKRQASALLLLSSRIPQTETQEAKYYCTSAIQSLRNLSDDLSYPAQAAQVLAAERSQQSFLDWMPKCEAEVDLPPTQRPNLRDR